MVEFTLTTTATLNAGSLTVTVYEFVDGGTNGSTDAIGNAYQNSVSVALAGGVDETNTLAGFDGSAGNTVWLHVEYGAPASPTDTSPTFSSYTLDTASTATVSGTVTLDSSALEGAKITVINDTQGAIQGTATTDVNGAYSVDCPPGDTVHVLLEYDDGAGTQYNDESQPFVVTQ